MQLLVPQLRSSGELLFHKFDLFSWKNQTFVIEAHLRIVSMSVVSSSLVLYRLHHIYFLQLKCTRIYIYIYIYMCVCVCVCVCVITQRRTRHDGFCWRISDVFQWTPTHGHTSVGWFSKTYKHQFCSNTGWSLEELLWATDNMDGWRERNRYSRHNTTWYWYFWMFLVFLLKIFVSKRPDSIFKQLFSIHTHTHTHINDHDYLQINS